MTKLFIFGSTGDLIKRKVLLALQEIKDLEVISVGRKEMNEEDYRKIYCSDCDKTFLQHLHYRKIELPEKDFCKNCSELFDRQKINFVFIALPPELQENALNSLLKLKEKGINLKILIEKPFGQDLESASKLVKLIKKENLEKDLFISDHYLFKSEIYDLKKIDFKSIKIVSAEKIGLERRAHYNSVGALKDMIQSHFLNIAFKLLDNPEEEFKDFKVLKYLRGQYEGYEKELGAKSDTETFVNLIIKTKNKIFNFTTGKCLKEKEIFIELDGSKTEFLDAENSYTLMFNDFFLGKKEKFPTLENVILAWKIVKGLGQKPKLTIYQKGLAIETLVL